MLQFRFAEKLKKSVKMLFMQVDKRNLEISKAGGARVERNIWLNKMSYVV